MARGAGAEADKLADGCVLHHLQGRGHRPDQACHLPRPPHFRGIGKDRLREGAGKAAAQGKVDDAHGLAPGLERPSRVLRGCAELGDCGGGALLAVKGDPHLAELGGDWHLGAGVTAGVGGGARAPGGAAKGHHLGFCNVCVHVVLQKACGQSKRVWRSAGYQQATQDHLHKATLGGGGASPSALGPSACPVARAARARM
jgi:hypothetical protein